MKHDKERTFNANRSILHLKKMFTAATDHLEKPLRDRKGKTNDLYRYQVDFAYLIDEIQRGPLFAAKKAINDANGLIDDIQTAHPKR